MTSNAPPERPDLTRLRRELRILITVIVVVVLSVLTLTAYLYHRFTAGVTVTP
jgi:hypothetical protein